MLLVEAKAWQGNFGWSPGYSQDFLTFDLNFPMRRETGLSLPLGPLLPGSEPCRRTRSLQRRNRTEVAKRAGTGWEVWWRETDSSLRSVVWISVL